MSALKHAVQLHEAHEEVGLHLAEIYGLSAAGQAISIPATRVGRSG